MDSVIWWVRRDMRLSDNAALLAALAHGLPVVPVFILAPQTEALGAAPRWRLGQAIAALDAALRAKGSRLTLRRGQALQVQPLLLWKKPASQHLRLDLPLLPFQIHPNLPGRPGEEHLITAVTEAHAAEPLSQRWCLAWRGMQRHRFRPQLQVIGQATAQLVPT